MSRPETLIRKTGDLPESLLGFFQAVAVHLKGREPQKSGGILRIELQRAPEFPFRFVGLFFDQIEFGERDGSRRRLGRALGGARQPRRDRPECGARPKSVAPPFRRIADQTGT